MDENQSTLPAGDVGMLAGRAPVSSTMPLSGMWPGSLRTQKLLRQPDSSEREQLDRIEDVRVVHVLTNGHVSGRDVDGLDILGRPVEYSVSDLERLFHTAGEG